MYNKAECVIQKQCLAEAIPHPVSKPDLPLKTSFDNKVHIQFLNVIQYQYTCYIRSLLPVYVDHYTDMQTGVVLVMVQTVQIAEWLQMTEMYRNIINTLYGNNTRN